MLTEEAQRAALVAVVNMISRLDITQTWGDGKTSSSDGQRFAFGRKLLQHTYSTKVSDFELEHISSISWENVILYGEYVLDRNLIKR